MNILRKKDIDLEISEVSSLHELVEVYGQIASVRMKKIRDTVLKNREFLASINSIFKDTLDAYSRKLSLFSTKRKGHSSKITFLAHNGKTVASFISANTGFYGEVVQKVFQSFSYDIKKNPQFEITIVGRLGRNLFTQVFPDRDFTYFDLPDYGIDKVQLSEVVRHLVQYEQIRIYYGRYKSVVTQIPYVFDITAGTQIEESPNLDVDHYLFEPSIEEILMFFETEIFASLFEQSVRESQLAKLASRIVSMDKANENIKDWLKDLAFERMRIIHRDMAKRQTNNLASMIYKYI